MASVPAPLFLLIGLVLLLVGGRLIVDGATGLAARLRVPPLLVGLTIVAWGTSAPELAFNAIAASQGRGALVFGNVVGANICNLALVLGVAALLAPIAVDSRLLRLEMPVVAMLQSALLVVALARASAGWRGSRDMDAGGDVAVELQTHAATTVNEVVGGFTRLDGVFLLLVFTVVMVITARSVTRVGEDDAVTLPDADGGMRDVARTIGGVLLLGIGGAFAADGAVGTALLLGMPESVVGLTIVAIGTTLPELVTGIIAVQRGQVGLLMGNAIGSCLFNVGVIFAIATLISPLPVPEGGIAALVVLTTVGLLLVPMSMTHDRTIARIEGLGLLLIYAAFLIAQALRSA